MKLTNKLLEESLYKAMCLAATIIPPDVKRALERALSEETDPLAKKHLELTLENAELAAAGEGLVCGDTGFPLFFIKASNSVQIEGGFGMLWDAAKKATIKATENGFLRPTMVDPITRNNPGNNIGNEMPHIHLEFDDDVNGIEIIAVPKGGGSEIFGTFYRMFYPSDGLAAVKKFVVDSIYQSCYAGKICPPAVVGIGIGGTADVCMNIAKKAATLVPLGSSSEDPEISKLEKELLVSIKQLGLGPMGSMGVNAVLALNIKTAVTHTAALPVSVNAQCSICRRYKAIIRENGEVIYTGEI